jgi:hypothetical protein
MSGSNSLLPNFQANNAQINRLNVQSLKVNNNINGNDEFLVLISLNIKDAIVTNNTVEFLSENLVLYEWDDRTINSQYKHNKNNKYVNDDAVFILKSLFSKNIQGEKNIIDNNANAQLILKNEWDNDRFITMKDINTSNDSIILYYELEENIDSLNNKTDDVKIIFDNFYSMYTAKYSSSYNQRTFETNSNYILRFFIYNDILNNTSYIRITGFNDEIRNRFNGNNSIKINVYDNNYNLVTTLNFIKYIKYPGNILSTGKIDNSIKNFFEDNNKFLYSI